MSVVQRVYEDIKRNVSPFTELTIYDPEGLAKGLNKEFYNPLYVKIAKKALEIILYNPQPSEVNSNKESKILYWFDGREVEVVGEGKYGIVFSPGEDIFYKQLGSMYLIKTSKNRSEELLYEFVIGSILNSLREEKGIFNFMYTYGDFTCGPPLQRNNQIVSWCRGSPETYYTVLENIPGTTLNRTIKNEEYDPLRCLSTILQTYSALKAAVAQFRFHHRDLHAGNIVLRSLDKEVFLPYEDWYVRAKEIAVMIDFGMSILEVNEGTIAYNTKTVTTRTSLGGDLYRIISNMYVILLGKERKTSREYQSLKILYGIVREFLPKEDQIRLSRLPFLRQRINNTEDNRKEILHYRREVKYFALRDVDKEFTNPDFLRFVEESVSIANAEVSLEMVLIKDLSKEKMNDISIAQCGPSYCAKEAPIILTKDEEEYLTYPLLSYGVRIRGMLEPKEVETLYMNTNNELTEIISSINESFKQIEDYGNKLKKEMNKEDAINYIVKFLNIQIYIDRLTYLKNAINYSAITEEEERIVLEIETIIIESTSLTKEELSILGRLEKYLRPLLVTKEKKGSMDSFTSESFDIAMEILLRKD